MTDLTLTVRIGDLSDGIDPDLVRADVENVLRGHLHQIPGGEYTTIEVDDQPPTVEILHERDPDSECYHTVWLGGARIDAATWDMDPGSGHLASEWVPPLTELLGQCSTPEVAQAIQNSYLEAADNSEHVDNDLEHWVEHNNDLGDWCPYSGQPVPPGEDATVCPQFCRASNTEDEDEPEDEPEDDDDENWRDSRAAEILRGTKQ